MAIFKKLTSSIQLWYKPISRHYIVCYTFILLKDILIWHLQRHPRLHCLEWMPFGWEVVCNLIWKWSKNEKQKIKIKKKGAILKKISKKMMFGRSMTIAFKSKVREKWGCWCCNVFRILCHLQFLGNHAIHMRSDTMFDSFIDVDDDTCQSGSVPLWNYASKTSAYPHYCQHGTNVPGTWTGASQPFVNLGNMNDNFIITSFSSRFFFFSIC